MYFRCGDVPCVVGQGIGEIRREKVKRHLGMGVVHAALIRPCYLARTAIVLRADLREDVR